jgi:hypothetical protein
LLSYNHSNYKNHSGNNSGLINLNISGHCLTNSEEKLLSTSYTTTIIVDVYLLAECCYTELINEFGCNLIEVNSDSFSSNISNPIIDCSHLDSLQQSNSNSVNNSQENASFACNNKSQLSKRSDASNGYELLERWKISMITSAR